MLALAQDRDHANIFGLGGLSAKEHNMLACTR